MQQLKILVLDDEEKITDQICKFLRKKNYQTLCVNHAQDAYKMLESEKVDIVISDIMLPDINGIEVLQKIKEKYPGIEVIMISGHGDMDSVIESMRLGAVDYLRKPFGPLDVQLAIERTGKYVELQNRLKSAENQLQLIENQKSLISRELENLIEKEFIGTSKAIKRVLELAIKAADDKDISVLITGENGTGKEIIARVIHYSSMRKKFPFYPVNSSAIPESLLESEFFGHLKGAFTGADKSKQGCFELANGGTLFLDEIADMPVSLQAKLLRALEENKIKPVGGSREIDVDVRIISASNKNIEALTRENKFRLDLYHRINTLEIHIPPLRERPEDIEPLLAHFINHFSRKKNIPAPAVESGLISNLKKYTFPGNVRELKNMVERALILSTDNILSCNDFPFNMSAAQNSCAEGGSQFYLEELEKDTIINALQKTNFNQSRAAVLLGISKDALFRRIKKFDIQITKDIS